MKYEKDFELVQEILEKHPECRKNDELLFKLFSISKGYAKDDGEFTYFRNGFFENRRVIFATIERARRWIQAGNESLKPSKKVQQARKQLQKIARITYGESVAKVYYEGVNQ